MYKVISESRIDKYITLGLNELPKKKCNKIRIDGEEYALVPTQCGLKDISIEDKLKGKNKSFIGKEVEFL